MYTLRVIQADFGDCFILEFGDPADPKYVLIDGGPREVYRRHLRGELVKIQQAGGRIEIAMISHVDTDHVMGVLDLAAELEEQQANGEDSLVEVGELWLNSFEKAIIGGTDIGSRLAGALATTPDAPALMANTHAALLGIGEGNRLRVRALLLGIPINPGFANELVCVDDRPDPIELDNLKLRIVGPTRANLDELQAEWVAWLDANDDTIAGADPRLLANSDDSIPNLSSIMVHAEADGKTLLLTGDGRSDHLLQGLAAADLLADDGTLHVDVLKVAHHGSNRNATKTFFRKVTADTYIISANYHPDNPDLSTLIWIVEAAQQQGRNITIKATNPVNSLTKLQELYPPGDYGYELESMPTHYHYWRHVLA